MKRPARRGASAPKRGGAKAPRAARPGSLAAQTAALPSSPAWAWVLGTWFGSGCSPIVPGTAGTAATLPLAWALGALTPSLTLGAQGWAWNPFCLLACLVLFFPSVWAADRLEKSLGRHDPGAVVCDETLGTLLTLAFLPAAAFHHWPAYAAAFFLFRFLDIWKPGLIGRSQDLPGGWGIVIDDVLAGLLGGVLLALVWWTWAR